MTYISIQITNTDGTQAQASASITDQATVDAARDLANTILVKATTQTT
jgi:hypothetical protein